MGSYGGVGRWRKVEKFTTCWIRSIESPVFGAHTMTHFKAIKPIYGILFWVLSGLSDIFSLFNCFIPVFKFGLINNLILIVLAYLKACYETWLSYGMFL